MDFPLINFDPTTGLASVGLPRAPRPVRGVAKLVQIVVIAIFKNRGQDVFTPIEGSGLRSLIGQFNYADPSEIKIEVLQRVERVQQEIISNQAGLSVPSSEKLSKLKVLGVVTDPANGDTAIRLQVFSESGQSTTVVV